MNCYIFPSSLKTGGQLHFVVTMFFPFENNIFSEYSSPKFQLVPFFLDHSAVAQTEWIRRLSFELGLDLKFY